MEIVKKKLDNIILGLLVGGIIPPALVRLFTLFSEEDLVKYSPTYFENICLLSIALNGGVMWLILNKAQMDKMGRGILLANFGYVIAFIIYFYT